MEKIEKKIGRPTLYSKVPRDVKEQEYPNIIYTTKGVVFVHIFKAKDMEASEYHTIAPEIDSKIGKKRDMILEVMYEKAHLQKDIENLEISFNESQNKIDSITKKAEEYKNLIVEKDKIIVEIDDKLNLISKKTGELEYKKKELVNKIDAWQKEKINAKQELDALSTKVSDLEDIIQKFNSQKQKFEGEIKVIKKKKNNILAIKVFNYLK